MRVRACRLSLFSRGRGHRAPRSRQPPNLSGNPATHVGRGDIRLPIVQQQRRSRCCVTAKRGSLRRHVWEMCTRLCKGSASESSVSLTENAANMSSLLTNAPFYIAIARRNARPTPQKTCLPPRRGVLGSSVRVFFCKLKAKNAPRSLAHNLQHIQLLQYTRRRQTHTHSRAYLPCSRRHSHLCRAACARTHTRVCLS